MDWLEIALWVPQAIVVFVVSTFLFDALHYMLHRWTKSPNKLLRKFASWHQVHHAFLDRAMRINPRWTRANIWCHLVPEYLTASAGTLAFLLIFPWQPVALVAAIQTIAFVCNIVTEGMDPHHMTMKRLSGITGIWWVNKSYHALHHIYPNKFYSSYTNAFDLLFGTGYQFERRTFLITGANGAFGSALVKRLEAAGAYVETAKYGEDYTVGQYDGLTEKMARAQVLVLAHGAKSVGCNDANNVTFVDMIEKFREIGKTRLVPPEIWGLGSEAELHGDMGMAELKDYAASKRAFAVKASQYYRAKDLTYRHIVPAAFTSRMGKGAISANMAVSIALFFIKRNFRYVPVTYTTLAYWNYFRFLAARGAQTTPSLNQPERA